MKIFIKEVREKSEFLSGKPTKVSDFFFPEITRNPDNQGVLRSNKDKDNFGKFGLLLFLKNRMQVSWPFSTLFLTFFFLSAAAPGLELKDMLRFATGLDSVPPFGFKTSKPVIKIEPLLMPKGKICFNQLTLPSLNASYFEFKTMMETAMEFGSELDEA